MDNKILISIKNVYGKETIYPECETAKNLAEIAGQKTLTEKTISLIKKMGYTIELQQQKINF